MQHQIILSEAKKAAEAIRRDRQFLHRHAETGFELPQTLAYVKQRLEEMGYAPVHCGKAGLVATAGTNHGKVLLLRADMDALPIREESGVSFACQEGRMHACGHDMHTAMLLGAAAILKQHEQALQGTVKLMFQPAEETFEGSADMIQAGVLENPKPDAAMMIHVTAGLPLSAGTVIISAPGVSAPAADYFTVTVQGKGCHGSAPQNGIDPLTTACHILLALQEIQARELAASEEAVLTVGTFHAGNAENVIPETAVMGGTIRTYDEDTRAYLKDRIRKIAGCVAEAFRAEATVTFGTGCPSLLNNTDLSNRVTGYLQELLGPRGALSAAQLNPGGKPSRGGGSEDFAYISREVPSLMLALAAGEPDKGFPYPQHHPMVRFDEEALPIGAAVFAYTALRFLDGK